MLKATRLVRTEWPGILTLRERWRDPLLTALTVLLALLLFVLAPLRADNIPGVQELGFALVAAVAGAVFFLSGRPVPIAALVLAIALAATAAVLRLQGPSTLDICLNATAWGLLSVSLIVEVGRAVFAPGRVTYHRIMGAILLYLAIGLAFVALYTFVGLATPGAFTGISIEDQPNLAATMIYFSFGTLTGAGAGEISAVDPVARSLANVQAMIGQLYPATLLARLVTLEIEDSGRS
jgi:hypothetical protein